MLHSANDATVQHCMKRMLKEKKVSEPNFRELCLQLQVQVSAEFGKFSMSEEEQEKMSSVLSQKLGTEWENIP